MTSSQAPQDDATAQTQTPSPSNSALGPPGAGLMNTPEEIMLGFGVNSPYDVPADFWDSVGRNADGTPKN